MLLSQEAVSIAYETVQPEDFYRPLHGQIFVPSSRSPTLASRSTT